jgi:hypothetical protein
MDRNLPARREKTFDLTTPEGRMNALQWLKEKPLHEQVVLVAAAAAFWPIIPTWLVTSGALRAYENLSRQNTDIIEAQKKTAVELIKAGREQHVDHMTLTMDQTVGLDLGAAVEGTPINATAKIGKSGHMIVEVKYKA